MRILFVRHGDPDYVNDTLTEKGHREAACLAEIAEDLKLGTWRYLKDFEVKKILIASINTAKNNK